MPEEGGSVAACAHAPGFVRHSPQRKGYLICCRTCAISLALIPDEWPVAQTLNMWQDDIQRWDYLREADRLQQEGTLCICGRRQDEWLHGTHADRISQSSRCGRCNPEAMRIVPPVAQPVYGTSLGAEAVSEIQREVLARVVERLANMPMTASEIVNRAAENSRTTARLNAEAANQRDIYTAAQAQNAIGLPNMYTQIKKVQKMPSPSHGIEDVRHKGGATAFRCICGWGISQQFAKTVFDAHGERELIKMLETHIAGGQVGPTTRPKMEWRTPNFVELLQHRPFWKSPICRQIWMTPVMSEPAFTPRRRIILEE